MASMSEVDGEAHRATMPKRRRFWFFDFLFSPFSDTDDRAHYKRNALRGRNEPRRAAFNTGVAANAARPPVRRFPRDGG
jgi:hypothetical protein